MPAPGSTTPESTRTEFLPVLAAYTEGKLKRYGLLFSVNGGAFAVISFLAGDRPLSAETAVIGGLSLRTLAVGLAVFTLVMCYDIWKFGEMMSARYYEGKVFFQAAGKGVLASIAALLVAGWLLAAFG